MALVSRQLAPGATRPPADVRRFLREAGRRIERFQRSHHIAGYVPSDFGAVYAALAWLEASEQVTGRWFCEWGSGFGVITCLAAMLGFEAWGIEAEEDLVEEAQLLAADFGVSAEFIAGSFVPDPMAARLGERRQFAWLSTEGPGGHEAMGLGPEEFDLIYVFPWPDEEGLIAEMFDTHARSDAMLLTYGEGDGLRLRQKCT